jgi:addiction module RelE/StbE family toxin
MGVKVILTGPARDDLGEIVKFISRDNPDAALRTGNALIERIENLGNFPYLGRVVPELRSENCRELVSAPYRIIYRVSEEKKVIEVLRIWHAARGEPEI